MPRDRLFTRTEQTFFCQCKEFWCHFLGFVLEGKLPSWLWETGALILSKCPLKVKQGNFPSKMNAINDTKNLELSKSVKKTGNICDRLWHLSRHWIKLKFPNATYSGLENYANVLHKNKAWSLVCHLQSWGQHGVCAPLHVFSGLFEQPLFSLDCLHVGQEVVACWLWRGGPQLGELAEALSCLGQVVALQLLSQVFAQLQNPGDATQKVACFLEPRNNNLILWWSMYACTRHEQ